MHILSSRGCNGSCNFCSINAFYKIGEGQKWRERSIASFVDEIESLEKIGVRTFKVLDDSLIEPPRGEEWCEKLADEIEKRKLKVRLRGSIRANKVNEKILVHLKRAGFFSFSCGIENFSQSALFRMRKAATVQDNISMLSACDRHDILVQAGHILFDPETTLQELHENLLGFERFPKIISKGVFTEMFAASGTVFGEELSKAGQENLLGNIRYEIRDPVVRQIHYLLKRWHKSHMALYDKAIDPLSAPKDISAKESCRFHDVIIALRKLDLLFFRDCLESFGYEKSEKQLDEFVKQKLDASAVGYKRLEENIDSLYLSAGLVYDANINPFF